MVVENLTNKTAQELLEAYRNASYDIRVCLNQTHEKIMIYSNIHNELTKRLDNEVKAYYEKL